MATKSASLTQKLEAIHSKSAAEFSAIPANSNPFPSLWLNGDLDQQKALAARTVPLYQWMLPKFERFFIENVAPTIVAETQSEYSLQGSSNPHESFLKAMYHKLQQRIVRGPRFYEDLESNSAQHDIVLLLKTLEYELNLPNSFWNFNLPFSQEVKPFPRTPEEIEKERIARKVGGDIYREISANEANYCHIFQKPLGVSKESTKNENICCSVVAMHIKCNFPFSIASNIAIAANFRMTPSYPKEDILKRVAALTQKATAQPNATAATATTATVAAATKPAKK